MNFRIEGDFGSINFSQSGNNRYMELPVDTAILFFRQIALRYPEIALNELGLFQLGSVGRRQKGRFASLSTPKHVLQPRINACTWRSKGKITMDITEIDLCPVEYNGEQCPDAFWGDCLEYIFGTGRTVHDLFGTPEGQKLMQEILRQVYLGLGNSFFELAWWGQHPLIDESDENGWYTVARDEWVDYLDQQQACGGWMTLIDQLKEEGEHENLNVPIDPTDVDGKKYIGSAIALLDTLFENAPTTLENIMDAEGDQYEPIVLLTDGIFNRLVEEFMLKFGTIPETMQYWVNSTTVVGGRRLLRNVFRYKGYVIYKVSAFKLFDQITGTITHRALLTVPRNFGMIYDIPELEQFRGMGLKVTQKLDAPWKGKVFMDTTFKIGTAIINVDAMVNASLTLTPENA